MCVKLPPRDLNFGPCPPSPPPPTTQELSTYRVTNGVRLQ